MEGNIDNNVNACCVPPSFLYDLIDYDNIRGSYYEIMIKL